MLLRHVGQMLQKLLEWYQTLKHKCRTKRSRKLLARSRKLHRANVETRQIC